MGELEKLDGLVFYVRIAGLHVAGIAQLVEHNLAKVGVASSSLVSRSKLLSLGLSGLFCVSGGSPDQNSHCRARWQSGHAAACKAVDAGSIPTLASILRVCAGVVEWYTHRT